jgi:hypothetical protein
MEGAMRDKKFSLLILLLAIIIFASFFMPWVHIESQVVGKVSKALSIGQDATLKSVSGYDIPVLANGKDAKLMIQLVQLFNPGIKDADKKSWLIWLVPLFAVLIFAAGLALYKNRWFNIAIGVTGVLIFIFALYKIKATDLDKTLVNVRIASGLWLLLMGYLAIGITHIVNFVRIIASRKGA